MATATHSALLFVVTVTTVDRNGVSHCHTYSDTFTDPTAARATAQGRVDRNEWAVLGHVRLILGAPADPDAPTARHETVWPSAA